MKFVKDSRGVGITIGKVLWLEELYVGFSWNPLILFNYEAVSNQSMGSYVCIYLFGFYVSWIKDTVHEED